MITLISTTDRERKTYDGRRECETDLFWKEPLRPRLKYSWIAKIIFLVFSKISFVNQTTENFFQV